MTTFFLAALRTRTRNMGRLGTVDGALVSFVLSVHFR